jgi:hypothetical protein
LPISKIATSVCAAIEVDALFGTLYLAIPFAAELRCLLDFAFSKTSLDNFQFWQCFGYHIEIAMAKRGNQFYN